LEYAPPRWATTKYQLHVRDCCEFDPRPQRIVSPRLSFEETVMNQNNAGPRPGWNFSRIAALTSVLCLAAAAVYFSHSTRAVKAADHRDSPTADANPEGDITDIFACVDPNDQTQLVLAMNVNPFSVPAEAPSYSFSNEFLYQFKFANDKNA